MKLNSGNNIIIVAHRGASYKAPENTIPSFQLAFEEGADFIEGDFWLTKDNEIVCIHDQNTKRATEDRIKTAVRSSSLAELKKLDIGSWKGKEYTGTQIPTLQEVLEIIPEGKGIYLEIKDYREIFLSKLAEVLKQYSIPNDKIRIISFNNKAIQSAKKNFPEIKVLRLFGCYLTKKRYFKFISHRWLKQAILEPTLDGIDIISAPFIDVKLVKLIRESSLDFCAYDVENIEDAVKLIKLGVDSITTNSPLRMREEIKRYFTQTN